MNNTDANGKAITKAVFREVILVLSIIVLQVVSNKASGKETDWLFTIAIGILVGVVDFVISYCKDTLEKVNYKINLPWKKMR